ncbi:MAG: serine/threonine-protein kinase [Pirellulales bacterium]
MKVSDQILDLLIECENCLRTGRPISIRDLADGDQDLEHELQDHIQKLTSTYWLLNQDHSIPIGLDIPSDSLLKQWQKLPGNLKHHELLGHLTQSRLVDPTELNQLIEQRNISNVYQLVDGLTDSKLLSAYQLRYIASGKAKNLSLGKYRILDKIGEGGMGTVYKARHSRLDRLVALKVVARNSKNKIASARFFREMQTVAKLSHPNIVTVHDSDEANNCQFMVMEYIDGRDLKEEVKRSGPLEVSKSVNYLLQAEPGGSIILTTPASSTEISNQPIFSLIKASLLKYWIWALPESKNQILVRPS